MPLAADPTIRNVKLTDKSEFGIAGRALLMMSLRVLRK